MLGMMPITDAEFERVIALVYDRFGIRLSDQKRSLVVGRLQKLVKNRGYSSFSEYMDYVVADTSTNATADLINRISTNHTYFFREKEHFDYFTAVALPEVIKRLRSQNKRNLRIWCAGCSSGEEAYTLMMLIMEYLGSEYPLWNAGLLATDISEQVLTTARAGMYCTDRMAQVPGALKLRYFTKTGQGSWTLSERVKKEITFRRFNLINERFPFKAPFQIIFCRNVMIYFDTQTRDTLANKFYGCTEPGGYLFIGHSESLGRDRAPYDYVKPAVYRRKV